MKMINCLLIQQPKPCQIMLFLQEYYQGKNKFNIDGTLLIAYDMKIALHHFPVIRFQLGRYSFI